MTENDILCKKCPHLEPYVRFTEKLSELIDNFENCNRRMASKILIHPDHWIAGASHWCGYPLVKDPTVAPGKYRVL